MSRFTVIQYNCGNSNHKATQPLFDSMPQARHQVLAIQEPGFNKLTNSTYCPKGYTLAFATLPTTKVCFMISREISAAHWKQTQYGPYIAAL